MEKIATSYILNRLAELNTGDVLPIFCNANKDHVRTLARKLEAKYSGVEVVLIASEHDPRESDYLEREHLKKHKMIASASEGKKKVAIITSASWEALDFKNEVSRIAILGESEPDTIKQIAGRFRNSKDIQVDVFGFPSPNDRKAPSWKTFKKNYEARHKAAQANYQDTGIEWEEYQYSNEVTRTLSKDGSLNGLELIRQYNEAQRWSKTPNEVREDIEANFEATTSTLRFGPAGEDQAKFETEFWNEFQEAKQVRKSERAGIEKEASEAARSSPQYVLTYACSANQVRFYDKQRLRKLQRYSVDPANPEYRKFLNQYGPEHYEVWRKIAHRLAYLLRWFQVDLQDALVEICKWEDGQPTKLISDHRWQKVKEDIATYGAIGSDKVGPKGKANRNAYHQLGEKLKQYQGRYTARKTLANTVREVPCYAELTDNAATRLVATLFHHEDRRVEGIWERKILEFHTLSEWAAQRSWRVRGTFVECPLSISIKVPLATVGESTAEENCQSWREREKEFASPPG